MLAKHNKMHIITLILYRTSVSAYITQRLKSVCDRLFFGGGILYRGIYYYVFRGAYSKDLDLDSLVNGYSGIVFTVCECGDVSCKEDGIIYIKCGCKTKPGHIKRAINSMCEVCKLKYMGEKK